MKKKVKREEGREIGEGKCKTKCSVKLERDSRVRNWREEVWRERLKDSKRAILEGLMIKFFLS